MERRQKAFTKEIMKTKREKEEKKKRSDNETKREEIRQRNKKIEIGQRDKKKRDETKKGHEWMSGQMSFDLSEREKRFLAKVV